MSVTAVPPASTVTSSGIVESHRWRSAPARPAGGSSLRSRRDRSAATRCRFSCRALGPRGVGVPQRGRLGNPPVLELLPVLLVRHPVPVRRLVVQHQEEGLSRRAVADEVEGEIRDDVRDVTPAVGLLAGRRVEDRVHVRALAGQDLPAVEARRVAAEVPLADHAGVVAAGLEQARHGLPRAVEPVEHRHAVQVRSTGPVRMAARLGVQIELVTKTLSNRMPSRARRSMFGVAFTREP